MDQPKDIWGAICERAGIEREPGEEGPPTHIPMTTIFAWFPTKDDPNDVNPACALPHATKPTVFEVGKPVPLKKALLTLAIFDDESTVRVYGIATKKSADPKENIPLRWTFSRANTTFSVAHFPDPATFLDCIAAELILAETELEEVVDPEEAPPPPLPTPGGPSAEQPG